MDLTTPSFKPDRHSDLSYTPVKFHDCILYISNVMVLKKICPKTER